MLSHLKLLVLAGLLLILLALVGRPFDLIAGQKSFATTVNPATTQKVDVLTSPCGGSSESGLPLPSTFLPNKLSDFQAQVKTFLTSGKYRDLHWCEG
jgi:hypothetical protein